MSFASWSFCVLSLVASPAIGQERGAFVTTLGRDTVAVERFAWTDSQLRGEVIQTSPVVSHTIYTVKLGPKGVPTEYLLEIRNVNDTAPVTRIHVTFDADSIRFTRSQGTKSRYDAALAEFPVFPENLYFWELYELQARAMVTIRADSVPFRMSSAGGAKPYTSVFRRRAPDTLSTKFFYPEYWMNYVVDRNGRLLAVDGSHTTIKVVALRQPDAPLEQFLASAAARERSGGAIGAMSRADSVTAIAGDATVSVAYSRPAARGRTVWGGIVPYGVVWRTGANSATRLHLSGALDMGGTTIPAGDYTLFSVPSADGAVLIINKQVGQWGTEYHPERDLVRIPVRVQHVGEKTELFTIRFGGTDQASQEMILEWDDVRWSVPIRKPNG